MNQTSAEYLGHQMLSVSQLKIMLEGILRPVLVSFAVFSVKEKLSWNYGAAAVCLAGAVYFLFRK